MRLVLVTLALLSAAPAIAGSKTGFGSFSRGFPGSSVSSGIVFRADFATTGCIASPVADSGQAITVTRASTKRCGSALTTCQNNEICVESDGALVEPLRTNYALQSNTIATGAAATAPWSLSAVTADDDFCVGPDGATTMDKFVSSTNVGAVSQTLTTASATTFATSAWVSSAGGTATESILHRCTGGVPSVCTCFVSSGTCTAATSGTDCWGYSSVGTTAVRLGVNVTCSVALTAPVVLLHPGQYNSSTGTGCFGEVQSEVGSYATSYIGHVTGTAQARQADNVTAPNGLTSGDWCVTMTAKPEATSWTYSGSEGLWSLGTFVAANSADLYTNPGGANGKLNFDVTDAAASTKTFATTSAIGTGTKTILACNVAATHTISIDGASTAGGTTGAGTGVIATMPATMRIGSMNTTFYFGGWIKNFKVCRKVPGGCL